MVRRLSPRAHPFLLVGLLVAQTVRAEEPAAPAAAAAPSSKPESGPNASEENLGELDLVRLLNVQVSTASKTSESMDEAPAIISVVTREDIQRWGYQSVAEALQHVVGFYLIDDHIIANTGVRGVTGGLGAESGVIKVMIDGRSVSYRTTSGNWLGVELVPLGSIKQIEIIRGPASALYGADAFLGVVNIITVDPAQAKTVEARVAGGYTSMNPQGRVDVVGSTLLGPIDVLVGVAAESNDRSGLDMPASSPAPLIPEYNSGQRYSRDLHRSSLVAQLRAGYRTEQGHLILSGYASGIERGGDFAQWSQFSSGVDRAGNAVGTVVSLGQVRLNADSLYHVTDTVDLALQGTYFQGGVLPQDRVEVASNLFYVERDFAYRGVDVNMEVRWTPNERFNAILGAETVFDHESLPNPIRISKETGRALGGDASSGATRDLLNVGTFLSANYQLVKQYLKASGGVRYDHHNLYGDQLTGRGGLTSNWGGGFGTKILYGSAFKAPTPMLLYSVPLRPGDVIGNENLKPQTIQTVEAQLSWKMNRSFSASTGVAYNWLFNKAEFTPQGLNQTAQNVSSQQGLSWETRADYTIGRKFQSYASFEIHQYSRDSGQEGYKADLVGSANNVFPNWVGRAGASVGLPSFFAAVPLEFATQAIVVGPRVASDTNIFETGRIYTLDPYVWLNASLSTRELYLIPGHETYFAIRVKNLIGGRQADPGFSGFDYPLAPREVFFEARHSY